MSIHSVHPAQADFTPTDRALYVVSCGCDADSPSRVSRPQGRNDYHLVYMAEGVGEFSVEGIMRTIPAGQCVLYRPFEEHTYAFSPHTPFRRYWIHFSGSKAADYMKELGLQSTKCLTISDSAQIEACFAAIIQELLIQDKHYLKSCAGHLLRLLVLLSRDSDFSSKQHISSYDRFKEVVYYIHEHYADNPDVQAYADLCHLSKYRFIVNFKKITGYTPIDYRNKVRIDHARRLLLESDVPVYALAEQLGFHSTSYFSTVFKSFVGCSPRTYRLNLLSDRDIPPP